MTVGLLGVRRALYHNYSPHKSTVTGKWNISHCRLAHFLNHTGANVAEVLQAAVTDWGLKKPNHGIAIVTDNARNMDVAVCEAGFEAHIKCFTHTINLATRAGFGVARVARLLGRVQSCGKNMIEQSKTKQMTAILPLF